MSSLSPLPPSPPDSALASPSSHHSDESSIISEPSFEYCRDADGNIYRAPRTASKSPQSTPPTPLDNGSPTTFDLPKSSLLIPQPSRRLSLSRSESLPPDNSGPSRLLQRVASGPATMAAVTPAQSSVNPLNPLSTGLRGTGRKIGGARRITIQEADRQRRENEEALRRQEELEKERERERLRKEIEEKENAELEQKPSPTSVQGRPIIGLPNRLSQPTYTRSTRSNSVAKLGSVYGKISETDASEGEYGEESEHDDIHDLKSAARQRQYLQLQSQFKQMRLSTIKASPEGRTAEQLPTSATLVQSQPIPMPLRPSSSMSTNSQRRRTRPDPDAPGTSAGDYMRTSYNSDVEDPYQMPTTTRKSPSPKLTQAQPVSSSYTHQRRESDTLRTAVSIPSRSTNFEHDPLPPSRISPKSQHIIQAQVSLRHRRSPTAPEAPTTSATIAPINSARENAGKTWAGDKDGYERERERAAEEFGDLKPPATTLVNPTAQSQQSAHPAFGPDMKSRNLVVNRKTYARLDLIGKGGSSRVYRVMNNANEIYAIKRVSLDKTDSETLKGYMNEIALLRRLDGNSRIIRLVDSEMKNTGQMKGYLLLVMECGEIDLARLLQERQKEPMNMLWISYYWEQMLQAVHVIHEEKIVHSDLKPANFVLVKGQLKLIDFGIANAIANDTTNIQRDHQIGTVNYMSPEAIELPEGMRRLKVGRPSDVWSLGCILYQMVYSHPPFHHLGIYQKMKAIPDASYAIDFPDYSVPSVSNRGSPTQAQAPTPPTTPPKLLDHLKRPVSVFVRETMKKCLLRNPKDRSAIPDLLAEEWMAMSDAPKPLVESKAEATTKLKLKDDEAVIDVRCMKQLLKYAIKLAREDELSEEAQDADAMRLVAELRHLPQNQEILGEQV